MTRRQARSTCVVMILASLLLVSFPSQAIEMQVPNLVAVPPGHIGVLLADGASQWDEDPKLAIRFSTTTANLGAYALEVRGIPKDTGELLDEKVYGAATKVARQCVWWISRVCAKEVDIGHFIYHHAHQHWHLEDYATYELRYLVDGEPDMSDAGLVAPARKASFCLLDYDQVERDPPGYDPLKTAGFYSGCSEYLQGISPGWADVYDSYLPDQQIPLEGIPDGTYALVITVNPFGVILETTLEDNTAWVTLEVIDHGTGVRVL